MLFRHLSSRETLSLLLAPKDVKARSDDDEFKLFTIQTSLINLII